MALKNPDTEYRSDVIRGFIGDDDERYGLFVKKLFHDIPNDHILRARVSSTTYDDVDDDVTADTFLRQARRDDADGSGLRRYNRRLFFEDRGTGEVFRDEEKGYHVRHLRRNGNGT